MYLSVLMKNLKIMNGKQQRKISFQVPSHVETDTITFGWHDPFKIKMKHATSIQHKKIS